jgi:hypothetical protein
VSLLPPQAPGGHDWEAVIQLRDAVRAEILRASGQPDLAH